MAKEKNAFCALLLFAALFSIPVLSLAQTNTKGAEAEMAVPPMKGKVYALVVGVSDYKNDMINDLRYAAADARAVAEYLKTGPLKVEKLIELYDKDATRSGIQNKGLAVIDGLVFDHVIQPEDMILVYLSGHGGAFTKDNSFFFPHDAAHATDAGTSFSIKRIKGKIRDWSTESKATVIFVFDACRSATLAKGQSEMDLTEVSKFLEEDTGELLLAASEGGEPALEKAELRHGVFSFCLLEALYGKADQNKDGWVSVGELKTYLDANVPDRTKSDPTPQRPMVKYPAGFGKKLVAPVTPELLAKADEKLKLDLSSAPVVQLAAKGGSSNAKANQLSELIGKFREALDKGNLVRPATACAYHYFQQMTKLVPVSSLQAELTDLKVALYDKALTTLNEDINGERKYMRGVGRTTYNTNYYNDARQGVEIYKRLSQGRSIDPDLEALESYLEARDLSVQFVNSGFEEHKLSKRAIKTLQTALEKHPDQAFLWQGLAMAYHDATSYSDGINAAEKAKAFAPFWSYPLVTMADCYFHQEDFETASAYLKEALELNQQDVCAFQWAGRVLMEFDRVDEAEEMLQKAVDLNPEDSELYRELGDILGRLGKEEEAIEKYKKATELSPNYAGAYFGWGVALHLLGRHEEAIEKFKKVTSLDPEFGPYTIWGVALNDLGRHEEAIEKYKKAIELNITDAFAYYNWGVTLNDLGRHEEAIEKYKKAIELDPSDVDAYLDWGVTLNDLGRHEEAIEKYKKAIELDPSDADAYYNWGNSLYHLGKYDEAIEKYKMVIELDPSDAWSYYEIGALHSKLGRAVEAAANYQRAIDLAGEDKALLAWSYLRLKEWDKSKSLFEESIRLAPDENSGYYDYACFFALTEKPSEALKQLEIAFSKGWKDWPYLERDEDLKSLRGLKEFNDLVAKYKKP
ncbi:MAG: tetratricopeptide repeat protein [Cyclobacteriaceae bacterium]|nr:tetratricopeptide repeat protein [Cyclobacteriaceae bacterium]